MSRIQVDRTAKRCQSVRGAPARPDERAASISMFECLVASASISRAAMLEEAAVDQGWRPIVCHDVDDAIRTAIRRRIRLAAIDLAPFGANPTRSAGNGSVKQKADGGRHVNGESRFRDVVEQIAVEDGPLMLICGSEGDPLEEIWARQHGAWMYLPGVDASTDFQMLFREAKVASLKMNPPPAEERDANRQAVAARPR